MIVELMPAGVWQQQHRSCRIHCRRRCPACAGSTDRFFATAAGTKTNYNARALKLCHELGIQTNQSADK